MKQQQLLDIIELHQRRGDGLIAILEEIQNKYGYLPADAIRVVAERSNRSLVDVYGVATFYKSFSLKPRGKHVCSVCLGTACHVRGAPLVAEEFARQLQVRPGETTADGEFTLETVACLGACALGPIVVVDGRYHSNVNTAKVKSILNQARTGARAAGTLETRAFPVTVACSRCNHSLMDPAHPIDGQPSVRVTVSFGGQHGWLRLSSLYGSYAVESEYEIPVDSVVDFFCPHCHAELNSSSRCPECGAPMVSMLVRAGGIVQICARRGCPGHMLDLTGAAA